MTPELFAAMAALIDPHAQGRAQAPEHAAFERDRFVQAGFPPLPEGEPRAFRRLILSDPYRMLAVPGVEVARSADGATTLTIQYAGWRSPPASLDEEVWATLIADDTVFAPRRVAAVSRAAEVDRGPPPPVCHDWGVSIQADDGRVASWHGCSDESPVGEAALRIIRLAMTTRPDCGFDPASPFFAFNTCFQPRPELDDPALETVFGPLRQAYEAMPGAQRLGTARQAIAALGDAPDDAAWARARAAVARVREGHDSRRGLLQQLIQLNHGAVDASAADKTKMRRTIEAWSSFLDAQDRNYIGLLEDLVRTSGRPEA